jgi:hypothetical protein
MDQQTLQDAVKQVFGATYGRRRCNNGKNLINH